MGEVRERIPCLAGEVTERTSLLSGEARERMACLACEVDHGNSCFIKAGELTSVCNGELYIGGIGGNASLADEIGEQIFCLTAEVGSEIPCFSDETDDTISFA